MSITTLAVILIGLFILLLIYWLIRSRGNTTGHIDTTLTGLGAATEAVEDIVDTMTHRAASPAKVETPAKAEAPSKVEAPVKASPPVKAVAPAPAKAPAKAAAPVAAKAKAAAAPAKAEKPVPAAKAAPKAKPAAVKAATPKAASAKADSTPDDLQQLKGVGPKLASLLTELGVRRFDEIAAWKAADIERIDAQLGTFQGRIARDNWVEQAGYLSKGDTAGFEAKFGKL